MFFLPKRFKYEVNANSKEIADKIQEKIIPDDVKGADGDEYDFNGIVNSDSFEITFNPHYTSTGKKSLYSKQVFFGSMKENNGKTTVDIKTKFPKRAIATLILFAVFLIGVEEIIKFVTEKGNLTDFLIYTAGALVVVYIVAEVVVSLSTIDVRERLEKIFNEFGYERIK